MSKVFLLISFVLMMVGATACSHLNSVSLTSIPLEREKKVQVERSKLIFLGLNFNNDYVNEMTKELQTKCPQGKVQGVLTKDETVNYLLFVKKRVIAEGFCIQNNEMKDSQMSTAAL